MRFTNPVSLSLQSAVATVEDAAARGEEAFNTAADDVKQALASLGTGLGGAGAGPDVTANQIGEITQDSIKDFLSE